MKVWKMSEYREKGLANGKDFYLIAVIFLNNTAEIKVYK